MALVSCDRVFFSSVLDGGDCTETNPFGDGMKKRVAVDEENVNKQAELVVLLDDRGRYLYRHVIRHLTVLFLYRLSWDRVYPSSVDVVGTFSIVRHDRTIQNSVVSENSSVF